MEEYSGKRAASGVGSSRRGSNLAFRGNHENQSIQYFDCIGCSTRVTRHNSSGATQVGNPEKLTSSRSSFLSTRGKAAVGNSSSAFTSLNIHKNPQQERRNSSSLQERVTVEISARQEQVEDVGSIVGEEEMITLEVDPPSVGLQTTLPDPEDLESSFVRGFSISPTEASTKCQVTSSSRARKPSNRKMESGNQVVSSSSSVGHSLVPKNVNHIVKQSQNLGANVYKHGLRNLSCTSISDVLPSGCSSSAVSLNKRTYVLRKRCSNVQSSSARGKATGESSNGGHPYSVRGSSSGPCLSPLERPSSQPASRNRNQLTSGDGVMSTRTQRSDSSNMRRLENVDADTFLLPELMIPPSSQGQYSFCEASSASSSRPFPTDLAPFHLSSSGRSGSSRTPYTRHMDHSADSTFRIFHGPCEDRDGYQHFNMEGIAEVLLALERIEQDEELTYEQLTTLESNLFLGGISFRDQHRDMRLDIDNMSYEELLDLEEKMGTVSTALSEAALSKCLDKSIYTSLLGAGIACGEDDVKCSICQEEYIVGNEVGKLHCGHCYHVACVNQWLRRKNWCPICKASACPS